jgi:hypothetical protein
MDLKIDELYKRLTISVRLDMGGDLGDMLNVTDNELYNDIDNYVNLSEGSFTKEVLEEKISDGLRLLMEMYSNEWTVKCEDCDATGCVECSNCDGDGEIEDEECDNCGGECEVICDTCDAEGEQLLHKAMDSKNVEPFKNSWELTELSSQWNSNDYTLVNEDDKNDLISYYDIIESK